MGNMVIYDSFFGNTEKIARAVAETLNTTAVRVGKAKPRELGPDLQLLVVGSPTRAFHPSPATNSFLKQLPSLSGIKIAAFDTRIETSEVKSRLLNFLVKLFGYAAAPIAAKLQKKGGKLGCPPEGFYVLGSEGPLKTGEIERAKTWARNLLK